MEDVPEVKEKRTRSRLPIPNSEREVHAASCALITASMESKGIKVQDVAAQLGISPSSLQAALNKRCMLSAARLLRVSMILGVEIADLLPRTAELVAEPSPAPALSAEAPTVGRLLSDSSWDGVDEASKALFVDQENTDEAEDVEPSATMPASTEVLYG